MAQLNNNLDYLVGKEIFTLSYEEAKKVNEFDMIKYRADNENLSEIIEAFIISASNNTTKKYSSLTLSQKEEVLKRMFIEIEEDLEISETEIIEEFEIEETEIEEFEID